MATVVGNMAIDSPTQAHKLLVQVLLSRKYIEHKLQEPLEALLASGIYTFFNQELFEKFMEVVFLPLAALAETSQFTATESIFTRRDYLRAIEKHCDEASQTAPASSQSSPEKSTRNGTKRKRSDNDDETTNYPPLLTEEPPTPDASRSQSLSRTTHTDSAPLVDSPVPVNYTPPAPPLTEELPPEVGNGGADLEDDNEETCNVQPPKKKTKTSKHTSVKFDAQKLLDELKDHVFEDYNNVSTKRSNYTFSDLHYTDESYFETIKTTSDINTELKAVKKIREYGSHLKLNNVYVTGGIIAAIRKVRKNRGYLKYVMNNTGLSKSQVDWYKDFYFLAVDYPLFRGCCAASSKIYKNSGKLLKYLEKKREENENDEEVIFWKDVGY